MFSSRRDPKGGDKGADTIAGPLQGGSGPAQPVPEAGGLLRARWRRRRQQRKRQRQIPEQKPQQNVRAPAKAAPFSFGLFVCSGRFSGRQAAAIGPLGSARQIERQRIGQEE